MSKINDNSKYLNENGFTLIEIIIYATISVILFCAVIYGQQIANRSYQTTVNTADEIRQARRALNTIFEELKFSSNMTISSNGISNYQIPEETASRSITLGPDNILYQKIGNNASKALINIPLQTFSVSYNASDADKRTINLCVKFSNSVEMNTSVRQLNTTGINN
jgi:Tfp pilus assembly protein PilW